MELCKDVVLAKELATSFAIPHCDLSNVRFGCGGWGDKLLPCSNFPNMGIKRQKPSVREERKGTCFVVVGSNGSRKT